MEYHSCNKVILLTKDFQTRRLFRKISSKFPNCSFKTLPSIDQLNSFRNIKVIFLEKKYSQSDIDCINYVKNIRKYHINFIDIPIILLMDECSFERLKIFFNSGIESVLYKPLKPNLLETVLLKHLTTLKDSTSQKRYHEIILYPELKVVYYKDCKIFLSDVETVILNTLLPQNNFTKITHHSLNNLKIEVKRKLEYEISDTYLRVSISRLRSKFVKYSNLNLIKNKYGRGYYIAI
jgi:DNA-binding response OmpR family regulator